MALAFYGCFFFPNCPASAAPSLLWCAGHLGCFEGTCGNDLRKERLPTVRSPSQLCIVSLALCSRHSEEVKVRACDLKTSRLWSPRVQFNPQQPQEEKCVHRLACLLVNFSQVCPEGKQPGSCSLCSGSLSASYK